MITAAKQHWLISAGVKVCTIKHCLAQATYVHTMTFSPSFATPNRSIYTVRNNQHMTGGQCSSCKPQPPQVSPVSWTAETTKPSNLAQVLGAWVKPT
jgi:hypothetical protein